MQDQNKTPLPLPDWMAGQTIPLFDETDKLGGTAAVALNYAMAGFPAPVELPPSATLRGLHKPTPSQRFMRIVRPFWRARLKRNIRAWLPAAVKDPRGVEAEFVANWSFELRFIFGE